ncbi:thiazolylpeptide-type bacteriocin [Kitasatospora sp. NPDC057541]|uniref:thiazolylpeptide-type bacteriocin n=1 Tax=unclassified Kitasatospora TaxID=2633591 RepID=UPI0036B25B49
MSDHLQDDLDLDDLDLGELTITALHDSIALPEGGASAGPISTSCNSSSHTSVILTPGTRY